MQRHNKSTGYRLGIVAAAFGLLTGMSACTKNFESYNTDNTGVSNGQLGPDFNSVGLFLKTAEMSILNFSGGGDPNSYQVQQNLNADIFSGYFMTPNHFSASNNSNYGLVTGWNGEAFKVGYLNIMAGMVTMQKSGIDKTYPQVWAVAQVVQVAAMSRVTDIYGPIPYSKVGQGLVNVPYDSQEDVYKQFFQQLDAATQTLRAQIQGGKPLPFDFSGFDVVYGGNFTQWLRFANSLRLRLAMHIRFVSSAAALAKSEAEKAMDPANGGLITDNADNMNVKVLGAFKNPLVAIAVNWADIRIGASIQCYLSGYKDPRITRYMDKSTDGTFPAKYQGIRIGSIVDKDKYKTYSSLNVNDGSSPAFSFTTPVQVMTAAEVYFLRAEAAMIGWNNAGGSAQQLYEQGINTSMAQWNVSAPNYITDATSVPDGYTDPKNSANNANSPSSIKIKWDEGASPAEKQERISTQKWIAMFPEGQEAWTEFRRTGYPKMFTVVNNNSGSQQISTTLGVRRLPFPLNEYSTTPQTVNDAIKLLNPQVDLGNTPVWWDTRQ